MSLLRRTVAQRLVTNEFDSSTDMRAQIIGNILDQNKEVSSWTGNESPYGYLDWWPNSLWMNTSVVSSSSVPWAIAVASACVSLKVLDIT